jgi:hypothetical protein
MPRTDLSTPQRALNSSIVLDAPTPEAMPVVSGKYLAPELEMSEPAVELSRAEVADTVNTKKPPKLPQESTTIEKLGMKTTNKPKNSGMGSMRDSTSWEAKRQSTMLPTSLPKEEEEANKAWLLDPHDWTTLIWRSLIFMLMCYQCWIVPYRLAFGFLNDATFFFDFCGDFCFLVDIFFNFRTVC